MFSKILTLGVAVFIAGVPSANAQGRGANGRGRNPAIRFQEMDRNNDREITRDEWRGSNQSFKVHDWNGDGRLAGDEVRIGAARADRGRDSDNFDYDEREYVFDDWTDRGFRALDYNRDSRITQDEWHFDREGFRRADHNGDRILSRAEFFSQDAVDDDRGDSFADLDVNRDGRLSREEWHGSPSQFAMLDVNHDGVVNRTEMLGTTAPPELFTSVDMNRDRVITTNEWQWSRASFDRLDVNRDGRLTAEEFRGTAAAPARSAAYRAGAERGVVEGRQAGREDRIQRGEWDLEGQTELEQADSGYNASIGPRADYQMGYREAFRRAYREGWDQAK
jgi:Ca2+-binding EF-hand superfamily protein